MHKTNVVIQYILFVNALFLLVFLAGCNSATPSQTSALVPTTLATDTKTPTLAPSATVTPQPTATLAPTDTLLPSSTPTDTITPLPTETNTPTPTIKPTRGLNSPGVYLIGLCKIFREPIYPWEHTICLAKVEVTPDGKMIFTISEKFHDWLVYADKTIPTFPPNSEQIYKDAKKRVKEMHLMDDTGKEYYVTDVGGVYATQGRYLLRADIPVYGTLTFEAPSKNAYTFTFDDIDDGFEANFVLRPLN